VSLARRPNGDFNVLTQSREKFHGASHRKIARPVSHQKGNLRLTHAQDFRDLGLRHAAIIENQIDLQGELRFQQLTFRIGKSRSAKTLALPSIR
jgi:hypothetical protein